MANTGNDGFCVLFDDAGLGLTLMKGRADLLYAPTLHIGFIQTSEQAVNALHEWLRADGFDDQLHDAHDRFGVRGGARPLGLSRIALVHISATDSRRDPSSTPANEPLWSNTVSFQF